MMSCSCAILVIYASYVSERQSYLAEENYLNVDSLRLATQPPIVGFNLRVQTFADSSFIIVSRSFPSKEIYHMIQVMVLWPAEC